MILTRGCPFCLQRTVSHNQDTGEFLCTNCGQAGLALVTPPMTIIYYVDADRMKCADPGRNSYIRDVRLGIAKP